MSAELNAAARTEPELPVTPKPVEMPVREKTENNTDPDPYCCVPKDPGGPDT